MCDSFYISHFSCLLISFTSLCFLSCTLCTVQLTPKNNGGFPLSLPLKSQKNRYTAIKFIDFLRFPLSIDQNHLIATDFYRHRFLSIDYSGYAQ